MTSWRHFPLKKLTLFTTTFYRVPPHFFQQRPKHLQPQMSVTESIEKHRAEIDQLKAKHEDLIAQCTRRTLEASGSTPVPKFDDLFIVRFIISNTPNVEAAEHSLVSTLNWRIENAETLHAVRRGAPPPFDDLIGPHCVVSLHKTTKQNEPVLIVRSGLTNVASLLSVASQLQISQWLLFQREVAFAICDEETRSRGVFVKCISINDFAGVSFGGFDRRFMQALGQASKWSEEYYCQLLGQSIMINLPSWAKVALNVAKVFMSQRMLDKLSSCPANPSAKSQKSFMECPWARVKFDANSLPTFLGGKCLCLEAGGCIQGVSNDFVGIVSASTSKKSVGAKEMAALDKLAAITQTFSIPAKSSETLSITRTSGGLFHYAVKVHGDHGINLLIQQSGKTILNQKIKGGDGGHLTVKGDGLTVKLENTSMTKSKQVVFRHAFE
jgi:hypothetical protein